MEYSNASPVMREHRLCRLSREWQKAGEKEIQRTLIRTQTAGIWGEPDGDCTGTYRLA